MRREQISQMYDFIVNPKARSGMGERIWKELEPEIIRERVSYRVHATQRSGHAEQIAGKITEDGRDHTIVILGGDGTVNEVINGIRDPAKVTIGYIPIGSSNDFARGLKLPKDPADALDAVLHSGNTKEMDLGYLTRGAQTRRFAVSAGTGFDAAVCREVGISRWKTALNRLGLGKLSYAVVALHRLATDRPVKMSVCTDDGRHMIFQRTYFAAFMNLPYEGGGFRFCPDASETDGMLDVIVVHSLPVPAILLLLPTAFAGKHTGFRGITVFRCRKVKVRTVKPLPLHTDGETWPPRTEAEAGILPARIRVITGRERTGKKERKRKQIRKIC